MAKASGTPLQFAATLDKVDTTLLDLKGPQRMAIAVKMPKTPPKTAVNREIQIVLINARRYSPLMVSR
jgi:hypothetical protein